MKIIKDKNEYWVYSDHLVVNDELAPGAYVIRFHPMRGYFLEDYNLAAISEKIYGSAHNTKVAKILNSFKEINRNLGVLLSGEKGSGKTVFTKMMVHQSIEAGHPVIIIDQGMPDVHTFISKLDSQRCVFIFDEFDKAFSPHSNPEAQVGLLGLFDGMMGGQHLFIVTCNNLRNVSEYMVNRPGRFMYHMSFSVPTESEIREYLQDKLDPKFHDQIEEVVGFAARVDLNYDCLRAIAFELSNGETFKEAITYLNILNVDDEKYNLSLYMSDGSIWETRNVYLDLFDKEQKIREWFSGKNNDGRCIICVADVADAVYNSKTGGYRIAGKQIKTTLERGYEWEPDIKNGKPLYLEIKKSPKRKLHYVFRKMGK